MDISGVDKCVGLPVFLVLAEMDGGVQRVGKATVSISLIRSDFLAAAVSVEFVLLRLWNGTVVLILPVGCLS